jgi:hypothetical protein
MAISTFDGPIRSLGGIFQQGPATIVTVTASTTLSPSAHGGRIVAVGGTLASNVVLTLPTINASTNAVSSGPGQNPDTLNNEGVVYTVWVPTTIATSSLKIGTDGTDKFIGTILGVDTDTSNALVAYTAGASDDFINFNGGTTGGVAGTWVQIVAIDALKYMVNGIALGSGTVATPFATS